MMASTLSYAFDESGNTIAFLGNEPLVGGSDFSQVVADAKERVAAMVAEEETQQETQKRVKATHITTPNGQRGTILGHTAGLWNDEVTVRMDNGEIRRFATFVGDGLAYSSERPKAPQSPVEYLEAKLAEDFTTDAVGLAKRLTAIERVRDEATNLLGNERLAAQHVNPLHELVLRTNAERNEIKAALTYLDEQSAEAFAPPTRAYAAVEQADMGPAANNSWLDVVAHEMIAESEGQDLDKLLNEGPTVFVSSLDDAVVANAGVVRELALDHVTAKTAGFKGDAVNDYRKMFLANVEVARKRDSKYRVDAKAEAIQKEASTTQDAPDEALYL